MHPQRQTNDERERRERAALRRALVEVVAHEGRRAASPASVARQAGLPLEAFGAHFASVQECLLAVYEDTLARLHQTVREAIEASAAKREREDWRSELDAAFGAALRFLASDPDLARVFIVEAPSAGDDVRERHEAALESFVACVDALRREHEAPVPPLAAELIVRGTDDLVYARVARGESTRLGDLLTGIRFMWLVPFVGRYRATGATGHEGEDPRSQDAD
jgi:AcrR family transcriptional regulator